MYYGASPMKVLEMADASVPDFVIDEINSLLVEAMKGILHIPCQLLLTKQIVEAKLVNAALKNGIEYDKRWLLNFPIYFLDNWEVTLPCSEYGYYRFSPKGLVIQD